MSSAERIYRVDGGVSVLGPNSWMETLSKRRRDGFWEILPSGLLRVMLKAEHAVPLGLFRICDLTFPDKVTGRNYYVEGKDFREQKMTACLTVDSSTHLPNMRGLPNILKKMKTVGANGTLLSSVKSPAPRLTTKGLEPLSSTHKRDRPTGDLSSVAGTSGTNSAKRIKLDKNDAELNRRDKENSENSEPVEVETISSRSTQNFYGTDQKKLNESYFPTSTATPVRSYTPQGKRRILESKDQLSWKDVAAISPVKPNLQGFSNLGNTCYMNAILQSLFILEPFAKEIWKSYQTLERYVSGNHLFKSFTQLLKNRDNAQKSVKDGFLRSIKEAISASATRFSGFSQNDAHEFLSQVLDQLKEEITGLTEGRLSSQRRPNPVTNNFEFSVCHAIKCSQCGNVVQKEENFSDLSLDMPSTSRLISSDSGFNLQDLLDTFFRKETVSYRCELCSATSSDITHKFTKLSRVLILHLKRYTFNATASTNVKIANHVTVPKYLTLSHHCAPSTQPSVALTDSVKKVNIFEGTPAGLKPKINNSATAARRQLNFCDTKPQKPIENNQNRLSLNGYQFKKGLDSISEEAEGHSKVETIDTIGDDEEDSEYQRAVNESLKDVPALSSEEEFQRQIQVALEASLKSSMIDDSAAYWGKESDDTDTVKENLNVSSVGIKCPSSCSADNKALERSLAENQGDADSPPMSPVDSTISERTKEESDKLQKNYTLGDLPHSFRLVGIVSHIGSSTSSGHYITDVWESRKGGWVSFDDSSASLIAEEEVLQKRKGSGYIFFYMAKDLVETMK